MAPYRAYRARPRLDTLDVRDLPPVYTVKVVSRSGGTGRSLALKSFAPGKSAGTGPDGAGRRRT
jgi:hypothetical protein